MITTESGEAVGMVRSLRESVRRWRWIIGVAALLALSGCSVLRIAYGQAPTFSYWWIDGYVDLTDEQSARLRPAIDRWFDWHRRVELPRYVALLDRAQREVMQPTLGPAQLCAWRDEAQRRLDAALDEATPMLGALMVSLSPEQIRHLERKMAKDGEELKRDFLQPDRAEREQASFKRTVARYENLYGRLDAAQRRKLSELLAASPFDAERWLAERERRNRDLVAMLTAVSGDGRDADPARAQLQAQAAVRTLAERVLRSPRPEYRSYQERLAQDNCALASAMHNAMTPAQRAHARDKLAGWQEDLRLVMANGNGGNGAAGGGAAERGTLR